MTALTGDIQPTRYGVAGSAHQPQNFPLSASTTVYRGSFACIAGTGTNQGYLKNASSLQTTDIIAGLIGNGGPGYANYSPGIANTSSTSGVVTVDVEEGSFYFISDGTLTQSNVGQTVYATNEYTVSSNSGLGPKAGILEYIDPNPPATAIGAYVVKLNQIGGP